MRKMMIAVGLVVVMLLGVTYVFAQAPGYGKMGWSYGKWSSSTPEQGTKYQQLHSRFNDEAVQFGPGLGMGPEFGGRHMMGYSHGRGGGYRMGSGYGTGPGCGTYY
jgi:hypothetical protein